jgi:nucleolin
MERGTQRPRGFGFVTLSTRDAAEKAIVKMDQAQLDGRTIRVNESRPKGSSAPGGAGGAGGRPGAPGGFNAAGAADVKLYVGNLAFDTVEENVRGTFEQYGKVVDCFLPTDRETGKVRGFAFVTMPAADAEAACFKLNGHEMDGRALRVNEAQPKGGDRGGGGGGGGALLYHTVCLYLYVCVCSSKLTCVFIYLTGYGGGGGYNGGGGGGYGGGGGRSGYDDRGGGGGM